MIRALGGAVDRPPSVDRDAATEAIWVAVKERRAEAVAPLISLGANVAASSRSGTGWTLLHECVRDVRADIRVVRLLVEAGADVNARIKRTQKTPLYSAVYHGRIDIVQYLLSHGARVDAGLLELALRDREIEVTLRDKKVAQLIGEHAVSDR